MTNTGIWVFTNLNSFVTESFTIQDMTDEYYLAAYDRSCNIWIRVSDITNDIKHLQKAMRDLQNAIIDSNIKSINYYEFKLKER